VFDSDCVESESEYPVESANCKRDSWLFYAFSEILALYCQVTHRQNVVGDDAFQRACAVANGEISAVLNMCGRFGSVVTLVEIASDTGATSGWNPEIGAIWSTFVLEKYLPVSITTVKV
jgi:hypothetical protein